MQQLLLSRNTRPDSTKIVVVHVPRSTPSPELGGKVAGAMRLSQIVVAIISIINSIFLKPVVVLVIGRKTLF